MKYEIMPLVCGAYQVNAYLLLPEGTKDAVLIDPGDDLFALKRALSEGGKTLKAILLTHGHFDHILSAGAMQRLAELVSEEQDKLCAANKRLKPVPIEKDLDGGEYRYRFFRIGQVSVSFRYVKGELI